jgi:protoporphyrinogen/coproporphyrinogen III oxidase
MAQLNMAEDVIPTSATSSAAVNRYIYHPDHLVRIPGPQPGVSRLGTLTSAIMAIAREPVFEGIVRGILKDSEADMRPSSLRDESVGDFVTRRFGQPVADHLVSALLHGIYAGDLYKLSVKMIFPLLWHLETIGKGSVVGNIGRQMWKGESLLPYDDVEFAMQSEPTLEIPENPMKALVNKLKGSSVYTLKNGLAQLAQRTEEALRENKNVEIKNMTAALAFDWKMKKFRITDADRKDSLPGENSNQYDYVVATISPSHLSQVLTRSDTCNTSPPAPPFTDMLKRLRTSTSTVNVMVVNLFYRNPNLVPVTGFGYLIPRSIPIEQNPERALGVIFGSETSRATFDNQPASEAMSMGQDSVLGTKLTVMMGGHWWNSWSPSDLPKESSAIEMAKDVLERHLNIVEAPAVAKARMQWNAIPQYQVGHHERMSRIHDDLRREFHGRLKVAGSAYQGVGVNDCVRAARKASFDIREGLDERTGLEGFGKEARWAIFKKKEGTVYLTGEGKRGASLKDS